MLKNPNFLHLIPLNPRIKIFFQIYSRVTFVYFIDLQLHAKFQKKNERSLRYLETDGRTGGHTNYKGDY